MADAQGGACPQPPAMSDTSRASHSITVIVSSYDHPRALALSLTGLQRQDGPPFDIILADDGSESDTFERVSDFQTEGLPIRVTTQPDRGFRKARALNQAIRAARGEQLIFLDGDCIPFPDFVTVHADAFGPRRYAVGGYVMVDLPTAQELTREDVATGRFESLRTPADRRRLAAIHRRNRFHIALRKRRKPRILGGNFSVGRQVLDEVNGFDERFDQFSGEDSDLRTRLNNAGARPTSLWSRAFVCHLDHHLDPARCRPQVVREKSDRRLLRGNRSLVRTEYGLAMPSRPCAMGTERATAPWSPEGGGYPTSEAPPDHGA